MEMDLTVPTSGHISATVELAIGAAGIYLATRLGALALLGPRGAERARAGRVALAHWLPVCSISITALFYNRPDIAIGAVFATAVAALSLAIGMICMLTPGEAPPSTRRAWPFLLPASLLVLIAGFSGALKLTHAVMFAAFGVAVWLVWRTYARETSADEAADLVASVQHTDGHHETSVGDPAAATFPGWTPARILKAVGGIVAIFAGGWFLIDGTIGAEGSSPIFQSALMAAGVISPLLTLPLLSLGTDMAQRNRGGEAVSACVGIALLNLLALLPALIVLWWIRLAWLGGAWPIASIKVPQGTSRFDALRLLLRKLPTIPMPVLTWRVDTILLMVLGVMLLPAAMGLWRIRRLEAIVLVLTYAGYLSVTAYMAVRIGGI
jgi:Ca2+/Na+ antiporter